MPQPQSLFSPKNASKITASEKISNISREANIADPDQTGAVFSGSTLFIYEASNSLVDVTKNIHFVIMRFQG